MTSGWLVFGFEFGESTDDPSVFLEAATVAGVYERDGDTFEFSHVVTELADTSTEAGVF